MTSNTYRGFIYSGGGKGIRIRPKPDAVAGCTDGAASRLETFFNNSWAGSAMELQSKTTVYVAIGSMLALMGGIIYYASLDNESLEQAEIELGSVTLRDVNTVTNQAEFEVEFIVSNPSEKTFTVASIGYQLYGDGTLLGSGQYSVIDIALPGRAVFYSGAVVPLKNTFVLDRGSVGEDTYDAMIDGRISSFAAEGILTTQTSWSTIDKEFRTGF